MLTTLGIELEPKGHPQHPAEQDASLVRSHFAEPKSVSLRVPGGPLGDLLPNRTPLPDPQVAQQLAYYQGYQMHSSI